MTYTVRFWRLLTGEQADTEREVRPACPGDWIRGIRCSAQPDHVVTWKVNKSALPGYASEETHFPCYRHLHRVIQFGQRQGGFTVVTEYRGV